MKFLSKRSRVAEKRQPGFLFEPRRQRGENNPAKGGVRNKRGKKMMKENKNWRRKGLSPKGTVPNVLAIIIVGFLIFAPSYLGAFSFAGVDSPAAEKTISASVFLNKTQFKTPNASSEYQQIYKMNDKVYRLNDVQVLVPLTPQEAIQYNQYREENITVKKDIGENTPFPQANIKVRNEFKEEAKEPQAIEEPLSPLVNPIQVINTDIGAADSLAQRDSAVEMLKGAEIEEGAEEGELNLLSVSTKTEGKPGQIRNQIKLEGISEDIEQDDGIRITPKIKVQGIYQGASAEAKAGQKTDKKFFDKTVIERR